MTWQTDILQGLGAPTSANNVSKMNAWNACEGNAPRQSGLPINNPFNTTLNYGGGKNVNSAGVKYYPSWSVGLQATLITLRSGSYVQIVSNLRNDGPFQAFATSVGASPWGTNGGCIAKAGPATPNDQQPSGSTSIQPGQVQFSYAQIEGIWIQAGGNAQVAPMAAAIAMAESGGSSTAAGHNTNGTTDRGLWQINSTHGAQSSFDVMTNARAAIAISNNGQSWRPWCTAYSDGACGTRGGGYLGPGSPYQRFYQPSVPPDTSVPINGTGAAQNGNQTAVTDSYTCNFWEQAIEPGWCFAAAEGGKAAAGAEGAAANIIISLVSGLINPMVQIFAGIMGITGGAILMGGGLFMIIANTQTGRQVGKAALFAAEPEASAVGAATQSGSTNPARLPDQRGAGGTGPRSGWAGIRPAQASPSSQQVAAKRELQRRQQQQVKKLSTQELLRLEAGKYGPVQT